MTNRCIHTSITDNLLAVYMAMLYWRVKQANGKWTFRAADWSVDLCSHCYHIKVLPLMDVSGDELSIDDAPYQEE